MWNWTVLCLVCLCIIQCTESLEIKGTYHTWLVTVPLPTHLVQQMLPDKVSLAIPDEFNFPATLHPIMLELGRELNCGPSISRLLQSNFSEGKFDIPFVKVSGKTGLFNLKQVVYVDNWLNSKAAALSYKLNSLFATMEMTETVYKVEYSGAKLQADVSIDGDWGTESSFQNFNFYKSILSQTWFGKDPNVTGHHTYDFEKARLRPVKVSLQTESGIFNEFFPLNKIEIDSIKQPFGAVEAYLNFTMP